MYSVVPIQSTVAILSYVSVVCGCGMMDPMNVAIASMIDSSSY